MSDNRGISFGEKSREAAGNDFANNRAYVIGINAYQNGIPQLHTAVADAARLGELLKESHGYTVLTLPRNGAPTLATLLDLLHKKMLQEVGPNDRVLFYFAGHGIALDGDDGPEGFLVPEDANREDRSSFLSMTELNDALAKLPCRHLLLILDCCFAGAFRWSSTRDLSGLPSIIHRERYERYIQDPAWQVLTSAAYDQKALDVLSGSTIGERTETAAHSPFASALFRALNGDADLIPRGKDGKPGGDGVITATELYLYLRESVETATVEQRMRQTPGLWPLKKHDKGEYILLSPGHELNLPPAPELNYANNPYRGLQSFDEEHSQLFFGRSKIVEQLHAYVIEKPFTVVLGASGTGKSSVVKAGLLAHLRETENENWIILPPIRPGRSPLATLANLTLPGEDHSTGESDRVERLRNEKNAFAERIKTWMEAKLGSSRLVVTVDQFEELVTLCDGGERQQFIKLLASAIQALPERFRLVITLRSDFEPQFLDCALKSQWAASRYVVPPMTTDELREAIEGPASVRVLYFQPAQMVDRLIDEVIQTPGAMPLLSFTLSELYIRYLERRGNDRSLTFEDYQQLGGVVGSLRNRATELYDNWDGPHQATMQRIMLRMVATSGGELARRRVPKSELVYPSNDENERIATILNVLSEARLVVEGKEVDGDPYVEPAHDALVTGWDKLLAWTRSEQEQLMLRRLLTPAANDWQAHQGGTWHSNPRVTLLKRISQSKDSWLNATETSFVIRSVAKRKRILVGAFSFVATAFVVVSTLAVVAHLARGRAVTAQKEAVNNAREANRQTANAYWRVGVIARDQDEGIKAAFNFLRAADACKQAGEPADQTQQRNIELAVQFASSSLVNSFPHDASVRGIQVSGNEARVLTWSDDGKVKLWDLTEAEPLREWEHDGGVAGAVFTRDESRVLAWSDDGAVKLWDVEQDMPLQVWKHRGWVSGAMFTRDESHVLAWSDDGAVKLWDVMKTEPIQEWKHDAGVLGAELSSDESRVLSWGEDAVVKLWDVAKAEPLQVWKWGDGDARGAVFTGAVFSCDESHVLAWGLDTDAKLFDVTKNQPLRVWDHANTVLGAVFTSDEMHVLTWSRDGAVKLWDVTKDEPLREWVHARGVDGAVFTSDESQVLVWSRDGTVRLLDITKDEPLREWKQDLKRGKIDVEFEFKLGMVDTVFTRDESRVLTWSSDGTVRLLDVTKDDPLQVWKHDGSVNGAVFTRDEARVLTWSKDGTVKLWDVARAEPLQVWKHTFSIRGAKFTQDESHVFTWSGSPKAGSVKLWSVTQAEPLRKWTHGETVLHAEFSRDESRVLTLSGFGSFMSQDGMVKLWDVKNDEPLGEWRNGLWGGGIKFTHADSQVITWGGSSGPRDYGAVKLWDLKKKDGPIRVWKHTLRVEHVEFGRDESSVLAWGKDGFVKLWDVTKDEPLQVWPHDSTIGGAKFIRNESKVVTWGGLNGPPDEGAIKLWDVTKDEPLQVWKHDDEVGGVLFTRDESRFFSWSYGVVKLWDVGLADSIQEWKYEPTVGLTQFTYNDARLLRWSHGGVDAVMWLWDATQAEHHQLWKYDEGGENAMFTRDGSRVLSWSYAGEVRLWDVTKDESLRVWKHDSEVGGVLCINGGVRVLTWSTEDGTLKLWSETTDDPLQVWKHDGSVNGAVFTRDEARILTWSNDGTVKLWDVTKAEPLKVWKHDGDVLGAVFTRDESRVLAWSNGVVNLWDAALRDVNLTPTERILELEVRSATRLDSAGQLVPLKSAEWIKLVRSPGYAAIQNKQKAADSSGPSN